MLTASEIKPGNIIAFDWDDRGDPPICLQFGTVDHVEETPTGVWVVFENGHRCRIERCAGLPVTDRMMTAYGYGDNKWGLMKKYPFIHQLQNAYFEKTGKKLERR